jgi:hypothetical protein
VDDTEDVTNQVTICDRVLEHNQGRPQRVRRQFKVVESKIATVIGGNTQVREKRAPLANVTLHLSRKHNGDVAYKLVDGRLPDDSSALEALHLELYTDALLPDGEEIGIGDKWDLENEDVRRALALDLTGSSLPPGVPSDAVWILIGGGGNGILDVVEFSGTAELSNLNVQYEDRTCAAIDIEIESSGRWSDVHREYDAGLPVVSTFHEIELHGRLLYDRTMNLPVFLFYRQAVVRSWPMSEAPVRLKSLALWGLLTLGAVLIVTVFTAYRTFVYLSNDPWVTGLPLSGTDCSTLMAAPVFVFACVVFVFGSTRVAAILFSIVCVLLSPQIGWDIGVHFYDKSMEPQTQAVEGFVPVLDRYKEESGSYPDSIEGLEGRPPWLTNDNYHSYEGTEFGIWVGAYYYESTHRLWLWN